MVRLQVVPGQEKKVKRSLEENRESQGIIEWITDVVVPTENVAEVKKGRTKNYREALVAWIYPPPHDSQ